jgi:hypothetical protein
MVVGTALAAVLLLTGWSHPNPTTGRPPSPQAAVPDFRTTVHRVGPGHDVQLRSSWRPGCPVHHNRLRLVTIPFWGYDGERHVGRLVVHLRAIEDMRYVFRRLYESRFQLRRMQPVDVYGGSDVRSMRANNTSAFNCRTVAGTSTWSEHAYGRAIDINPHQNPYVDDGVVQPAAGRPWVNRSHGTPGMIRPRTLVTHAFAARGWGWGGRWTSKKDYMHFSESGR